MGKKEGETQEGRPYTLETLVQRLRGGELTVEDVKQHQNDHIAPGQSVGTLMRDNMAFSLYRVEEGKYVPDDSYAVSAAAQFIGNLTIEQQNALRKREKETGKSATDLIKEALGIDNKKE